MNGGDCLSIQRLRETCDSKKLILLPGGSLLPGFLMHRSSKTLLSAEPLLQYLNMMFLQNSFHLEEEQRFISFIARLPGDILKTLILCRLRQALSVPYLMHFRKS